MPYRPLMELKMTEYSETAANDKIAEFLTSELGSKDVPFSIELQGCPEIGERYAWAFWVLEHDTTSYMHDSTGHIEWYGTSWDDKGLSDA